LREGQLVEGTITHLTKFGAFARLSDDMEGLIHISELSEQRINHPKEVVKEGDVVTLRVIKIDAERRRIGLSLRKVDSAQYADLDWKIMISEEVKDTQIEHSQEQPVEQLVEEPVEQPVKQLVEEPVEQPVEQLAEEPVEQPGEEPPAEEG
jgi:small subunit ribosomal protein S1